MNNRMTLIVVRVFLATSLLTATGFGQSQEKVLYSFCSATNCADGSIPLGKLVSDSAGNLYGTTAAGGAYGSESLGGTAFELSPSQDGSWTYAVLHSFGLGNDGSSPEAGLIFDKAGNLYGTTFAGGTLLQGTVFELTPPGQHGGSWTETILWDFGAYPDGVDLASDLVFDAAGNLYGSTYEGGEFSGGIVFQLVPPSSGTQWSENILFAFDPKRDGALPGSGVIFDKDGNLYGTTIQGGTGQGLFGVIYKLSPNAQLPWTETVLFNFNKESGYNPEADLAFDSLGNLYGTTLNGGKDVYGTAFRLAPKNGNKFSALSFSSFDGEYPRAGLLIGGDAAYGAGSYGGSGEYGTNGGGGTVYKIQGQSATVLYNFCSQPQCADGYRPWGDLISDKDGNLYGTASGGGANLTGGVVFEILTPAK